MTYCRRQGQPSKVPSVPSTFSELEALGTEDLAAAVTDEERYTKIVRDLMAASNVVQVGVWRHPLLLLHVMCGLHLFPELGTWSGPVWLMTAFSDLWEPMPVNGTQLKTPGSIWQGALGAPGISLENRDMGGALLLVDSIWGTLLECSSALPAQHAECGEQGS